MELILLISATALMFWWFILREPSSKNTAEKDATAADRRSENQQPSTYRNTELSASKTMTDRADSPAVTKLTLEDKIQQAIATRRDLTFQYTDKYGEVTSRRITPNEIKPYHFETGTGYTSCVEAYCHLRKGSRVFAIKRMSKIIFH